MLAQPPTWLKLGSRHLDRRNNPPAARFQSVSYLPKMPLGHSQPASPCPRFSVSPCLRVSVSPVSVSPCLRVPAVAVSPCRRVSVSPCHRCPRVTASPCPRVPAVSVSPCLRVPASPCPRCLRVPVSPRLRVPVSPRPRVTASPHAVSPFPSQTAAFSIVTCSILTSETGRSLRSVWPNAIASTTSCP